MQSGLNSGEIEAMRWDHLIHGEEIDARGRAAIDFGRTYSTAIHELRYIPPKFELLVDGSTYSTEEPEIALAGLKNSAILIETTTLSFIEILLCCRGLRDLGVASFSMLYTEPESYYSPQRSHIVHRRDFELSDQVQEFAGVPGNTILLTGGRSVKTVVLLGFEGQRLARFLEQTGISGSACSMIFGVPAFHPGWEMDAFVNNFRVVKGREMAGKVYFCGANNVLSAYQGIERIYNSCTNERLLITPIGTKPHGIGAALFLCGHPDAGVVYDNPKRKRDRTDKTGAWHLFTIGF
jgi:hypothetical protein